MKGFIIIKNNNIKFIKNKSSPLICRKRYIKIGFRYCYTRRYRVGIQTIHSFMKDYPPLMYPDFKIPTEVKGIVRSIGDTSTIPPNTIIWYEDPTV